MSSYKLLETSHGKQTHKMSRSECLAMNCAQHERGRYASCVPRVMECVRKGSEEYVGRSLGERNLRVHVECVK